jgi:hypothetical protein
MLVEMLCQSVLKLTDPLVAVILVGDVGARVAMYYMDLELRIKEKRAREMRSVHPRVTHFKDYGPGITYDIYSLSDSARQTWTLALKNLLRDFHHDDTIRGTMEAMVIWEKKCRTLELNLTPTFMPIVFFCNEWSQPFRVWSEEGILYLY